MRGSSELEFCIIVHLVHLQSFILISYIISVLSIRPLKSAQKIQIQKRYLIGYLIQNKFLFLFLFHWNQKTCQSLMCFRVRDYF